jgi:hypothetical protein
MSNLVDHARRELTIIGQFEEDPEFAMSILTAVACFSAYGGHSGASAAIATDMLNRLLQFQNLGPLTDDPDEWIDVAGYAPEDERGMWQSCRNPEAFSRDAGKTYYLLSEKGYKEDRITMHESVVHTPKPFIELSDAAPAIEVSDD